MTIDIRTVAKSVARRDFDNPAEIRDSAEFLRSYVQEPSNLTKPNRKNLLSAFRFLAGAFGVEIAQAHLIRCVTLGLPVNEACAIALHMNRYVADYEGAARSIRVIMDAFMVTPYGLHLLGESLVAADLLDEFEQTAVEARELFGSLDDGRRGPSPHQWASLALSFGLPDIADYFLPLIDYPQFQSALEGRRSTYSTRTSDIPTKMINLDRDTRKWNIASAAFTRAGYAQLSRVDAFNGAALPATAMSFLFDKSTDTTVVPPGAVGCWLSHIKVWEEVAESTDEWTLVLEDDAFPFVGASFAESTLPLLAEYDFAWANLRMAGIHRKDSYEWSQSTYPIWDQLLQWDERRRGVGTDGYLLTTRGAQILLEMTESEKIRGHVDGQIAAHTLRDSECVSPSNEVQMQMLKRKMSYPYKKVLPATTLNLPLVSDLSFGVSSTVFQAKKS